MYKAGQWTRDMQTRKNCSNMSWVLRLYLSSSSSKFTGEGAKETGERLPLAEAAAAALNRSKCCNAEAFEGEALDGESPDASERV